MAKNTRSRSVRPGHGPTHPGVRLPPDPSARSSGIRTVVFGSQKRASEPTPAHLKLVAYPRNPAQLEGFKAECVVDGRSYMAVDGVVFEILDRGERIERVREPTAGLRRRLGL